MGWESGGSHWNPITSQSLMGENDYKAKDPGIDTKKGYGGAVAGSDQWGNESQNALQQSGNYDAAALAALQDPRITKDYTQAGKQVQSAQYSGGLANLLFQQGVDKSIAAQTAMSHSGNPNQSGLAAYNAAQQGAAIQQNAVGQGTMADLQMKEQYDALSAQTALANRQENLGLLGLSQQQAQYGAGLQAQLGSQQQQLGMGLAGLQLQQAGGLQQGSEAYNQQKASNSLTAQGINAGIASQNAQANSQMLSGIVGAAGGLIALSDIRAKTDVQPAGRSVASGIGGALTGFANGMNGRPAVDAATLRAAREHSGSRGSSPLDEASADAALRKWADMPEGTSLSDSMQQSSPVSAASPSVPYQAPLMGPQLGAGDYDSRLTSRNALGPLAITMPERSVPGPYIPSDGDMKTDARTSKGRTLTAHDLREQLAPSSSHATEADHFLETMQPYSYRYKDPANEPTDSPSGGRYLGVMAQNVERGPTGDTIVKNTPRGKVLEGTALMSAMAAGEGRLHERLQAVEQRLASMKRGA